jgi:hypothetical protein
MRFIIYMIVIAVLSNGIASANQSSSGLLGLTVASKSGGVPPGLAKKGGMPPGLAKKFGPTVPAQAYVAVDPRYDDRAWFLIDGRWVLKQGFGSDLRGEVRSLMTLPPVPEPPVPLPSVEVAFRVVLFQ